MKFSTRTDKEITAERLFEAVSDFDRIERILMRRGLSVTRVNNAAEGARAWDLAFDWRGQRRELRLVLVQFDRPEHLALSGQSAPFDLRIDMSVVAPSRQKSRLIFELEVKPRHMRARLALQTAKLGKAQIDRKFAEKVRSFVDNAVG
ncbi:hypothetical protein [Paracoccus sediminicola]|uniref:hypothetical protein n=1 Tax=Paracoccus sediminicola TaxID=3017783 RepID=UPI0022F1286C|nr:hypothetical protein [Paracoccus sediminicola]WBU57743.1 hypothetical protein PAF18_04715 [Paracoccus sediminicola]